MRVGVVSTYPPRACGIGTFSRDLRDALLGRRRRRRPSTSWRSCARTTPPRRPRSSPGSTRTSAATTRRPPACSSAAATTSSSSSTSTASSAGRKARTSCRSPTELRQPMVLTLHTVLSAPSVRQAETLRALCDLATLVCVFTETARRMVVDARLAPPERVRVVPHGGPTELLPRPTPAPAARPGRARRDRRRPLGARDLRPDLTRQGDRDRDRGDAGDRRAPPEGALRDRRPDPPRGGQAPRRGVPDLARTAGSRPRSGRPRRLRRPLPRTSTTCRRCSRRRRST